MITIETNPPTSINGISRTEFDSLAGYDPIRIAEITSIGRFLMARRGLFMGRVLDYGAGKPGTCREPQPYRAIVEGPLAKYLPYDIGDTLPEPPFDVILCTQVIQYVRDPQGTLNQFAAWLRPLSGTLVLTYPTNWEECEAGDLFRFTANGMGRLLDRAGFSVCENEPRAEVKVGPFSFKLGYGVVAVSR